MNARDFALPELACAELLILARKIIQVHSSCFQAACLNYSFAAFQYVKSRGRSEHVRVINSSDERGLVYFPYKMQVVGEPPILAI